MGHGHDDHGHASAHGHGAADAHGHGGGHDGGSASHGPAEFPPVPDPRVISPAREDFEQPWPGRLLLWPAVWAVVGLLLFVAVRSWGRPIGAYDAESHGAESHGAGHGGTGHGTTEGGPEAHPSGRGHEPGMEPEPAMGAEHAK